jgi:hypothetical protein
MRSTAGSGGLFNLIKLSRSAQVALICVLSADGFGLLGSDSLASSYSDAYSDGLGGLGEGHGEGARHLEGGASCSPL